MIPAGKKSSRLYPSSKPINLAKQPYRAVEFLAAAFSLRRRSSSMPSRPRFSLTLPFLAFALCVAAPAQQEPWLNNNLSPADRAHDLVAQMTLDEKVSQLEDWGTAIPRLGVPDYQTWNEALHGVARAGYATA